MHPEPPGDKEHWIRGEDGILHVPDATEDPLCGHETHKSPFHYTQIGLDVDSVEDWRLQYVCDECTGQLDA